MEILQICFTATLHVETTAAKLIINIVGAPLAAPWAGQALPLQNEASETGNAEFQRVKRS